MSLWRGAHCLLNTTRANVWVSSNIQIDVQGGTPLIQPSFQQYFSSPQTIELDVETKTAFHGLLIVKIRKKMKS